MLDVVYYPVSAILWFWHTVAGALLLPGGLSWAVAIGLLVLSVRLALLRPFVRQLRSQRILQAIRPRIAELTQRHAGDRVAAAAAIRKLQAAHGVSPFTGLLPSVAQGVVLFGLYHVLRSFVPSSWPLGTTVVNYALPAGDVRSFLAARLGGSPLAAAINSATGFAGVSTGQVAAVAVPLMLIAAVATHLTSRAALGRAAMSGVQQPRWLNLLALWVFPAAALVGGPFLPVSVLVYWVSGNTCTLVLTRLVHRHLDRQGSPDPGPRGPVVRS